MSKKNTTQKKARALQARTKWSYMECLRCVNTMTDGAIEMLVTMRKGGTVEQMLGTVMAETARIKAETKEVLEKTEMIKKEIVAKEAEAERLKNETAQIKEETASLNRGIEIMKAETERIKAETAKIRAATTEMRVDGKTRLN